jgi:hypothetical protein
VVKIKQHFPNFDQDIVLNKAKLNVAIGRSTTLGTNLDIYDPEYNKTGIVRATCFGRDESGKSRKNVAYHAYSSGDKVPEMPDMTKNGWVEKVESRILRGCETTIQSLNAHPGVIELLGPVTKQERVEPASQNLQEDPPGSSTIDIVEFHVPTAVYFTSTEARVLFTLCKRDDIDYDIFKTINTRIERLKRANSSH